MSRELDAKTSAKKVDLDALYAEANQWASAGEDIREKIEGLIQNLQNDELFELSLQISKKEKFRQKEEGEVFNMNLSITFVDLFVKMSRLNRELDDEMSSFRIEPPLAAEFLVSLFSKKRYRDSLLEALSEDFDRDLAAGVSLRRACLRYWAAALNSIGPQALAAAKRIGIVGLVFDYARRWMG